MASFIPDAPLLHRALHFTGAVTLSVATFCGITALRLWPYHAPVGLAESGIITLGALFQFWMAEVLHQLARLTESLRDQVPERRNAETRSPLGTGS